MPSHTLFQRVFDKLSSDIQVDGLCTYGSLVVIVLSSWNYKNLRNHVFPRLKRLNKITTIIIIIIIIIMIIIINENHSKSPKLVNKHFSSNSKNSRTFFGFSQKFYPFAACDPPCGL